MSFVQQLGRNVVRAQQWHEFEWQQYQAETEWLLQLWVAEIKEKFMKECMAASHRRELCCTMFVRYPDRLTVRGVCKDFLLQQLWGILAELGFHKWQNGHVAHIEKDPQNPVLSTYAKMTAAWTADHATSPSTEPTPAVSSGTSSLSGASRGPGALRTRGLRALPPWEASPCPVPAVGSSRWGGAQLGKQGFRVRKVEKSKSRKVEKSKSSGSEGFWGRKVGKNEKSKSQKVEKLKTF
eukprot:s5573_g4.t1